MFSCFLTMTTDFMLDASTLEDMNVEKEKNYL